MSRHSVSIVLLAAAALLVAGTLAAQGIFLAESQPQLVSTYVPDVLPAMDPRSPAWGLASPIEVPLVAQASAPPFLSRQTVPTVRVQSVNNGQWIAFLLEWPDSTRNASASRPDEFRDAAAVQFPVDGKIPGVCMGVRGRPVNIWHWKADWQEDMDKGFRDVPDAYPNFFKDYYPFVKGQPPFKLATDFQGPDALSFMTGRAAGNPLSQITRASPIEELGAIGFSSATHRTRQDVAGRGVWSNGNWRVVFARPMATGDAEGVQFAPGGAVYTAFAVWNGANGDVGSKKQLSADVLVAIGAPSPLAAAFANWDKWWMTFAIVLAVGLAVIAAALYARKEMSTKEAAR